MLGNRQLIIIIGAEIKSEFQAQWKSRGGVFNAVAESKEKLLKDLLSCSFAQISMAL